MKLLTKPSSTREVIECEVPARRETRFNPLGIFGFGPIMTTRDIPARKVVSPYPGRSVLDKIEIDFEDEDAITTCIDVGVCDYIKKRTEFPLMFDGEIYVLHGVVPLERLRENIWKCNIDYFECKRREYGIVGADATE
jgi:hypothetical protein